MSDRQRRRFLIEVEGDFSVQTHTSDVADAIDRVFSDDWRVPNVRDFSGEKGCAVYEVALPWAITGLEFGRRKPLDNERYATAQEARAAYTNLLAGREPSHWTVQDLRVERVS